VVVYSVTSYSSHFRKLKLISF